MDSIMEYLHTPNGANHRVRSTAEESGTTIVSSPFLSLSLRSHAVGSMISESELNLN